MKDLELDCPVTNRKLSKAPGIVAFTGHMMDKPGRPSPRFPLAKEQQVVLAVRQMLRKLDARIGFSSAACGGDIIFLEEMLARRGEVHIVLPYAVDQFEKDCLVGFSENPRTKWLSRFKKVWKQASSRTRLGDRRANDNSMASEYCGRVFLGLALLKAKRFGAPLTLVALWDGWSGDAPGGTRNLVTLADSRGVKIEYLPQLRPRTVSQILHAAAPPTGIGSKPGRADTIALPLGTLRPSSNASQLDRSGPPGKSSYVEPPQQMCAVLFADVISFSKLDETKLPNFITGYLQPLARTIQFARHNGYGPLDFNTWGDGLFCIFDSLFKAGQFALEMQRLVVSGQWQLTRGAEKLRLRIALHAGPVYRIPDPIFPKDTFLGTNINFAARIEPVTPPGEIYCSEAFAALAAVEGAQDFAFKYVGKIKSLSVINI